MEESAARRKVVPATFGRSTRSDHEPRSTFQPSVQEAAPAPPAPTPEAAIALLAGALESMRLTAERLAEQARSDALEIGFQVARRILEMEVSQSPEPLFALIRSALRKAGEAREVTVRLSPDDEVRVREALAERPDALTTATVRLESDGSLSPGDCIVEGEFGVVDGRLTTRLDEMQSAVMGAVGQGRRTA